MSKRNTFLFVLTLLLIVTVAAVGCKKKEAEVEPTPPPAPVETPKPAPPPEPREEVEDTGFKQAEPEPVRELTAAEITGQLQTVYFDYDKSDLDDSDRRTIRANVDVLKKNANVGVVIEGHCDERGTIEYNLALGERRAKAVRDYMVSLGIPASRVRIVSFGEERPAVQGHTESAWSKNRRGEFKAE